MSTPSTVCNICLETSQTYHQNICGELCSGFVCESCLSLHFKHLLVSSLHGFAVKITCPVHINRIANNWSSRFMKNEETFIKEVNQRASMSLSLQCYQCHHLTSLLEKYNENIENDLIHNKSINYLNIQKSFHDYLNGELTATDFFTVILNEKDMIDYIKQILQCIKDPERRSTLQFRYLKYNPKIYTPCCKAMHCFSCSISGYHENQSCEEYQYEQSTSLEKMNNKLFNLKNKNQDILPCPSCSLQLIKGDGCSSVTCPCGHQFNWAKVRNDLTKHLSDFFNDKFKLQAPEVCAEQLYELSMTKENDNDDDEDIHNNSVYHYGEYASAWANHHPEELRIGRSKFFQKLYPQYTAEASLFLQMTTGPSHNLHCLARDYAKFNNELILKVKNDRKEARIRHWYCLYQHSNEKCGQACYQVLIKKSNGLMNSRLNIVCDNWMRHNTENEKETMVQGYQVRMRNANAWDFLHNGQNIHYYFNQSNKNIDNICDMVSSGTSSSYSSPASLLATNDRLVDVAALKAVETISQYANIRSNKKKSNLNIGLGDTRERLLEDWMQIHERGRLVDARALRWEYYTTYTSEEQEEENYTVLQSTSSSSSSTTTPTCSTVYQFISNNQTFSHALMRAMNFINEKKSRNYNQQKLKKFKQINLDREAFMNKYQNLILEKKKNEKLELAKEYEKKFPSKSVAAASAFHLASKADLMLAFNKFKNSKYVNKTPECTNFNPLIDHSTEQSAEAVKQEEVKLMDIPWYSHWHGSLIRLQKRPTSNHELKSEISLMLNWVELNVEVMQEEWNSICIMLEQEQNDCNQSVKNTWLKMVSFQSMVDERSEIVS